jgi:hypothetical protein
VPPRPARLGSGSPRKVGAELLTRLESLPQSSEVDRIAIGYSTGSELEAYAKEMTIADQA